MTTSSVLIVIAMEAEASPLVEHLGLHPDDAFFPPETPFRARRGTRGGCALTVVTNGKDGVHGTGVDNVGTVPAAMATFLALQKLKSDDGKLPDMIINAGTCGGFRRKGADIGDVFLTTAAANHDRRIPIPGGYVPYGVGRIESLNVARLASHIDAKLGVCTTGNSVDCTGEDARRMAANDASVKDMEAAAVAWAAALWGVPHFGVKVVTDVVDGERPVDEEFAENLGTAARSLQAALPRVVDYVCARGRDEL